MADYPWLYCNLFVIYEPLQDLSYSRHAFVIQTGRSSSKLAKDSLGGGDLYRVSHRSYTLCTVSQTHIDVLGRGLVLSVADSAILLDDHSPAAVPVTHASSPAVVLGERRVAHEEGLAVLGAAVDLAPGVHDERVVGGDDDDLVDALGGQLLLVLQVGRDVHGLAAGGEGAGDGDEDDLLAGELLAGVVGLREAAGGGGGVGDGSPAVGGAVSAECIVLFCLIMDAGCLLELDVRGELVASLDGSHCDDLVGDVG